MIQELIIGALLLGALVFLGRSVFLSFKPGSNCASGCGKCGISPGTLSSKK